MKGSYKVVLCPRSGEGYFGLARRTYSLQCPPDIARYALIASHFASVMKQYPTEAAELFQAAQENAQWRVEDTKACSAPTGPTRSFPAFNL